MVSISTSPRLAIRLQWKCILIPFRLSTIGTTDTAFTRIEAVMAIRERPGIEPIKILLRMDMITSAVWGIQQLKMVWGSLHVISFHSPINNVPPRLLLWNAIIPTLVLYSHSTHTP